MKHKIIVIEISFPDRGNVYEEKHKTIIRELQIELFRNGYRWANNGTEVQNFYSNKEYIVLIGNVMYTMKMDGIKYLKKEHNVHFAGSALTYSRYLKLKKLNII